MTSVVITTELDDSTTPRLQARSFEKQLECCMDPPGCGCRDVSLPLRWSIILKVRSLTLQFCCEEQGYHCCPGHGGWFLGWKNGLSMDKNDFARWLEPRESSFEKASSGLRIDSNILACQYLGIFGFHHLYTLLSPCLMMWSVEHGSCREINASKNAWYLPISASNSNICCRLSYAIFTPSRRHLANHLLSRLKSRVLRCRARCMSPKCIYIHIYCT
jgi:hypothetical protein